MTTNGFNYGTMDEERKELYEQFQTIDVNNSGSIDMSELKAALDLCGFKLPQYKVRQLIEEFDRDKRGASRGTLSFEEFEALCQSLKAKDVAATFKQVVSKRENLETIGGMSDASSQGTTHSVRLEEQLAFSDWVNSNLGEDLDLKHLLPIKDDGKSLYDTVKDGILLCKIINHSCPDTIDERAINKKNLTLYTKHENLTLALYSAQSIGCNIINIDAHDLAKGKPHLVLGLLWQIIRIGLFNQITLEHCPGLMNLLGDGEKIEELMKLSPEAILLRWVNYHLERAGTNRRCNNFTSDITDSEIYSYLLKEISPPDAGVNTEALREKDLLERAEVMLQQAEKLGCRSFVTPEDVVNGIYKLNLAFVANLFNNHPGLHRDEGEVIEGLENIEETREEKTYRNWMNSMGVSPHVNWLYSDLADGLVIFQLYDIIRPGIVNWPRVHKKFSKLRKFMEKLENSNYVVELGKQLRFSLVGIAGQDISDGNPTLTLALIWQLMRAYTLSVLSQLTDHGNPVVEKEIIDWVNSKLSSANKRSCLRSFQESSISDARVVIDLVDAIKPGTVNYEVVREGGTEEDKLANAKYAISMARKIGARIYALPEDITEVKPKMVMTVFACLMARDYIPNLDSKN
ncbi:plastin-1-like [Artemia franciscana]|uniref:plastin-1-like n=1 Tax=Artemia franciscana TaxID=6661 RepID=UPI0032DBB9A5